MSLKLPIPVPPAGKKKPHPAPHGRRRKACKAAPSTPPAGK